MCVGRVFGVVCASRPSAGMVSRMCGELWGVSWGVLSIGLCVRHVLEPGVCLSVEFVMFLGSV